MDKEEDVFDRIVRQIYDEDDLRYAVRRYGYGPKHDRVEIARHVPQHFITCY